MLVALVGGSLLRKCINTIVSIYFLGYPICTSALSHDIRSRDLKLVNANALILEPL
jgi:hypothetical protein